MLQLTGVKAVAVARGCIGNPWIFTQARRLMDGMPLDEALSDLGRRVGVPIVAEIPLIEVPYISLKIDRGTLETAINMITDIHPMEVKYRKGKIFFFWR